MTKCDNCTNSAEYVLDVPWGLPQHFCEGCLPRAVRIQFGPEYLKTVAKEPTVEAVAETVVEEPAPKKKKSAVAVEEAVAEDVAQVAANVSDN
jgi:hypothetical protein